MQIWTIWIALSIVVKVAIHTEHIGYSFSRNSKKIIINCSCIIRIPQHHRRIMPVNPIGRVCSPIVQTPWAPKTNQWWDCVTMETLRNIAETTSGQWGCLLTIQLIRSSINLVLFSLLFVLFHAQDPKQSLYLVLILFLMMDFQIYYDLIVRVVESTPCTSRNSAWGNRNLHTQRSYLGISCITQ